MAERGTIMKVLTSGTPLSLDLVAEGWPFLSLEDKRTILNTKFRYRRHLGKVLDVALVDPNPVVRWMAANHISRPTEHTPEEVREEEQLRWDKVQSDPIAFVRMPWDEATWGLGLGYRKDADVFDRFWALPTYERLLKVHGMTDGEFISGAVQYLVEQDLIGKRIGLSAVLDVLIQFFTWNDFKTDMQGRIDSDDGPDGTNGWKDCLALWTLVAKAKEWPWIVSTLLEFLPSNGCTLENIEALKPNQLRTLLYRQDFDDLGYYRKELFKKGDRDIKNAALSCRTFSFPDSEFGDFFLDEGDSLDARAAKILNIRLLAESYAGGNLAQLIAIAEQASRTRDEYLKTASSFDYDPVSRPFAEQRVKVLPYTKLAKEVLDLRVFILAEGLSDGRDHLLEGFGRFEKDLHLVVVKGAPWKTYMAFKSKLSAWGLETVLDKLPSITMFQVEGIPPHLAQNLDDSPRTLADLTPGSTVMATLPPGEQVLASMLNGEFAAIQDVSARLGAKIEVLNASILRINKMASWLLAILTGCAMTLLLRGCR